uniref:Expressed protein n=1 Tax=Oryza sativa subsp. japonica TaxID=39947 RepID=Q2QXG6_ORYSJ|nr:expressed protein [Oryza sativa Japonica Group]
MAGEVASSVSFWNSKVMLPLYNCIEQRSYLDTWMAPFHVSKLKYILSNSFSDISFWPISGDLRSALVNGEDRDYAQGGAEVTRVRILGGQLQSTVGIGTKLKEELRSRLLSISGDEVGYEMVHGGWIPCRRDIRNGLHEVAMQRLGWIQTVSPWRAR